MNQAHEVVIHITCSAMSDLGLFVSRTFCKCTDASHRIVSETENGTMFPEANLNRRKSP